MIERTTFDLRLAEHRATTARIEASGWQRQRDTPRRPERASVAAALAALGARLAQAAHAVAHASNRQPGRDAA